MVFSLQQGLSHKEYEEKKELVADEIIIRLEKKLFPGLKDSVVLKEVFELFLNWEESVNY